MDLRKFFEQLKASGVSAKDAWAKALEVYSKKAAEPVMKEFYPDFAIPADAAPAALPAQPVVQDVAGAIKTERKRVADIKASGLTLGVTEEVIEDAIESGNTLAEASVKFIAAVKDKKIAVPAMPRIQVGPEDCEKFQALAVDAIMDNAGLLQDKVRQVEVRKSGAEAAPRTLHGLFRTVLARNGVRGVESMIESDLVDAVFKNRKFSNSTSQGTGDFTNILANVANKSLALGIAQAPVTYPVWTKKRPVKDFRQATVASLSDFSDVEVIPEHAKPQHGSFSDKKEVGTLRTSGKIYTISRNALVNDDLSAFTDTPRNMGMAIENAKEKELYDYLFGTTFAGPTMTEDGGALLNATAVTSSGGHANLVSSGGAAPSRTTLDAGILAIMKAPRMKGNPKDTSRPTGAVPKFLIVPPDLLSTAWTLLASQQLALTTYLNGPNPFATGGINPLQIVCPAYLTTKTTVGWYLATDPNVIGTITMLTLMGKSGPTLTQQDSAIDAALGVSYLIYDDWRWMADDWRGLYCNDGD